MRDFCSVPPSAYEHTYWTRFIMLCLAGKKLHLRWRETSYFMYGKYKGKGCCFFLRCANKISSTPTCRWDYSAVAKNQPWLHCKQTVGSAVYVHEVGKAGIFLNSTVLCTSLSWLLVTLSIAGFLYASCSSLFPGLPWLAILLASWYLGKHCKKVTVLGYISRTKHNGKVETPCLNGWRMLTKRDPWGPRNHLPQMIPGWKTLLWHLWLGF